MPSNLSRVILSAVSDIIVIDHEYELRVTVRFAASVGGSSRAQSPVDSPVTCMTWYKPVRKPKVGEQGSPQDAIEET